MKKRIFYGSIVFVVLTSLVLIYSSCNPLSGTDVLQGSDSIEPVITITSPADGEPYSSTVTVTGNVSDMADAENEGLVDSVAWEITGTALSGTVEIETDGNFSFEFTTVGLTGTVSLKITAVDWNGNSAEVTLGLVAPKEITYFAFLAEDNSSLSTDSEGLILGMDIAVSLPDGTDLSTLIASFKITGTAVTVSGIGQQSGFTENDFRVPVDYVVTANDGTTKTYTVTAGAVPLPPTDPQNTALTADTIELGWTDNANNETGYELQRKAGSDGSYAGIASLDIDATSYTDSTFSGAAVYYYRVRAVNSAGPSTWAELTVDVTPPKPTGLTITQVTADQIDLSWNYTSVNETGFEIQRKADEGPYQVIAPPQTADARSYSDTTVLGHVTYAYQIRAINDHAASDWSDTVSATTPLFDGLSVIIDWGIAFAASVYATDLDGDADADIITASNPILWMENRLNQTEGDFFEENIEGTDIGEYMSVYAADLDGDGDPDILSASPDPGNVAWYENRLNQVEADFSTGTDIETVMGPMSVYAADLDGDGDPDVLSAVDDRIVWYENKLNESNGFSGIDITTSFISARAVYAADLDGDGDADVLAVSHSDDRIAWYENRLDETEADFSAGTDITTSADGVISVFATDLDGDGDADVLSASELDDRIVWYENRLDESAGFTAGTDITTSTDRAMAVYASDLDGDGDADVLSASCTDDRIVWYENRLDETAADFSTGTDITASADGARSVYATDLDGDGDIEVLSASFEDERILCYENKLID